MPDRVILKRKVKKQDVGRDACFLCTRTRKGIMQLRLPVSDAGRKGGMRNVQDWDM